MINQRLKDTSMLFSSENNIALCNKLPIPSIRTSLVSDAKLIACLHSLQSVKRDLHKKHHPKTKYQSQQSQNIQAHKENSQLQFPIVNTKAKKSQTAENSFLFQNQNSYKLIKSSANFSPYTDHVQNSSKEVAKRAIKILKLQNLSKNKQVVDNKNSNKTNTMMRFRMKRPVHLYEQATGKTLSKQNKYFPTQLKKINYQQIDKVGLYQTGNRYRKQCIPEDALQKLSPKIKRKQIQFVKMCKQNQLFLTRPKHLAPFQLGQFLNSQFEVKDNQYRAACSQKNVYSNQNINKHFQETICEEEDHTIQDMSLNQKDYNAEPTQNTRHVWVIQITNYQIQTTQQYIQFKTKHIQNWAEIISLFSQIQVYLKYMKISHCKFQAERLASFWSGAKLTNRQIEQIIKLKPNYSSHQIAKNVLKIWLAKRQAKRIINQHKHKICLVKWVRDRLKGIMAIKKQREYKINKALQMQNSLQQNNCSWDTQIYISSFSESQFVRNSTQYMESFQNIFCHMWRQSSKQMILVVPAINCQLLKIYQQKLKVKRSITIICPQVHQIFPTNISLASSLFFSYEAINKIKKLITNKKAILIPGKFSDPHYQLLISQYLKAPLMASLQKKIEFKAQKQIFRRCLFSELPCTSLEQNSTQLQIVKRFSQLIVRNKNVSTWIFKINGQFGGRGLATFSGTSSKKYRQILQQSHEGETRDLEMYLQRNLKLKLKVNFENCLFMVSDYFISLQQKGGLIEQQKGNVQSYELSFLIQNKQVNLLACFKGFSVNYSNKAYVYEATLPQIIQKRITFLRDTLVKQKYLGYVSIVLTVAEDEIYGIQIKTYMTPLSSIQPFIRTLQSKRQLKLDLNGNNYQKSEVQSSWRKDFISKKKNQVFQINNIQNSCKQQKQGNRDSAINLNFSDTQLNTLRFTSRNSSFKYLFIPYIILTDVPTNKKAQLIQQLINQTWNNRKVNILNQCALYLSSGLTLSLLVVGKDMKMIKKKVIQMISKLSERANSLKIYVGRHQTKDIFHFGDLIKAITQIKC